MKSRNSIYVIVGISIFVGAIHFLIGPQYNGIFHEFFSGYLIDILLPMNVYLLLQIALRKRTNTLYSRILGVLITLAIGVTVEFLQYYEISFLGTTYDPLDLIMYGIGVVMGLLIDFLLLDKFEKAYRKKENMGKTKG